MENIRYLRNKFRLNYSKVFDVLHTGCWAKILKEAGSGKEAGRRDAYEKVRICSFYILCPRNAGIKIMKEANVSVGDDEIGFKF